MLKAQQKQNTIEAEFMTDGMLVCTAGYYVPNVRITKIYCDTKQNINVYQNKNHRVSNV